jgi:hypothetical protein
LADPAPHRHWRREGDVVEAALARLQPPSEDVFIESSLGLLVPSYFDLKIPDEGG